MQKIGIIDLGSNTTRLIVMAYELGHSFRLMDEVSETVRLAEGVGSSGTLRAAPIHRAVEALSMFERFCHNTGVTQIIAVGTSAIREAQNQDVFWNALHQQTGLDLQIISAEEEAHFGYLGTVNALTISDGFVFDTGGGSTQVSAVRNHRRLRSFSAQAGVLRFTERFVKSDPISKNDMRRLREGAQQAFAELDWVRGGDGLQLAGMGGTVRTLARMDQKQRGYPLDRVHGYVLARESISRMIEEMAGRTRRERESIPGLKSDRADVSLAGAVIIDQLMEQGGFSELTVSGQGVREGIFYKHFLQPADPPILENQREFSILNLARLHGYEPAHCAKVAELSLSLYDQLAPIHLYGAWERELLGYAALIHDIGVQVGYYDHHKHSAYLVFNAAMLGFSHREIIILACLVRNHRKGMADTAEYAQILQPDDEQRIARLSALLRLAEYLERSKSQVVRAVQVHATEDAIRILVYADGDPTVEIWDANRRAGLMKKAFGRAIEIIAAP
ncbi:Ppx/GppA family phosphatase [Chloroflexales bacterium ZM16-3]|nr:Ppx/GppA family phosphatase [Chloroflexales bacterium ZM16-3]